ncbi:hypothetical protein CO057_02435 [Candidatus Uhrbacteria bacterium CG_4_9_14_0_2_um_filter_41_50]|uniref:Hydrogenase n=1 Tax=Candidatus Uhrbacteria bacterium CG_4_9_14_0_2_um_filter_41_50 TaxID=1975031 RepID=A0A2M8EP40_9BACT|nr:MAG: hypothetical protein COZ45_04290 [Candidatus Uhrbacteria bacterium CG_4_10_14_3_um_filter_41_21]PIZ54394.1 MAG: hypothetical protein COY24_03930 [Candidatus Uhrbacteria bacterium CG_4_10_14_0_2_um_filter_41_21]PJB84992.1 MAG: hypothetical protein CO086_00580 [Candidatus Uhrbacteria bacterium CG_4_9_14_0_8_um_filter_41_16]PJC24499.1 MAG: hypothetical protein CO057_02435 [Candidatus Uhrbacteria bacterium CG_4_9_14_0_2_um_filter_41_50]PJE74725.1 MAG: hypothetical protein COV03_03905 [Candi
MSLTLWSNLFTAGLLMFSLILISKHRLPALIRHFVFASLCLAGLILTNSLIHGDEHEMYVVIGTIIIKVIAIPIIMTNSARRVHASMQLKFYLKPTATYFILAIMLMGIAYMTQLFPVIPFVSSSLIIIGFILMIIRKDLYSQIIGFMTIENGIATFGILSMIGIPLTIEAGILLTLTTGVIIMAILSRQIQEEYATGDTSSLTELTE